MVFIHAAGKVLLWYLFGAYLADSYNALEWDKLGLIVFLMIAFELMRDAHQEYKLEQHKRTNI